MTFQRQALFWLAALCLFCLFVYVFRSVLAPFVAGMALAYFLDPVADRLERMGFSRLWATATIVGAFFVVFTVLVILIIPTLVTQIGAFIDRFPTLVGRLEQFIETNRLAKWVGEHLPGTNGGDLQSSMSDLMRQGSNWVASLLKSVLSGGEAIIGVFAFLFISPIVAFYLLWDWDRMVAQIDRWLPRDHADTIRELARQIDEALSGFVRGQITVALILGTFYAIALSIMGLNFALLIGIAAGILNVIPYIGSISGFIIAVSVALFQFWPEWPWIAAVAAVFVAGQVSEGNILQPLLVGDKVGLHPVWLMFGLIAFSSLFGFAGTLLAVPAAAAIGVLVRFGLQQYLDSHFYHGHSGAAALPAKSADKDGDA